MLKKSLAIGLSVVMAAEVLTGCSGGSGTTETKAADTGKTEAASEAATEGGSGEGGEADCCVWRYEVFFPSGLTIEGTACCRSPR